MRLAAALLLAAAALLGQGCVVVTATAAGVASVTAAAVKTTAKVTTATVTTTGKVTAAALTSSGDVAALTLESAGRLARSGMVVLVDAGTGAVYELPWREGLELKGALESGRVRGAFKAVKIFRDGQVIRATLGGSRKNTPTLFPRDVVELLRAARE